MTDSLHHDIMHSVPGMRWHGSVGRAHRSHRWGRWFESNCHHHSEALVDQGLPLFYPPGITAEGCTFFRVHLVDVNGSGRHSVHTVVWLSCQKIGVALLVESTGFVSLFSEFACQGILINWNLLIWFFAFFQMVYLPETFFLYCFHILRIK